HCVVAGATFKSVVAGASDNTVIAVQQPLVHIPSIVGILRIVKTGKRPIETAHLVHKGRTVVLQELDTGEDPAGAAAERVVYQVCSDEPDDKTVCQLDKL